MKDSRGHITESGLGHPSNTEGQRILSRGMLVFVLVTPAGAREINEEKTKRTHLVGDCLQVKHHILLPGIPGSPPRHRGVPAPHPMTAAAPSTEHLPKTPLL